MVISNFRLKQNYPHPFNPKTVIRFQLPVSSEVDLSIYNLLGQMLVTLVSEKQPAGTYKTDWDTSDLSGGQTGFAAGVYFCRPQTDRGFTQTKKLILLK